MAAAAVDVDGDQLATDIEKSVAGFFGGVRPNSGEDLKRPKVGDWVRFFLAHFEAAAVGVDHENAGIVNEPR